MSHLQRFHKESCTKTGLSPYPPFCRTFGALPLLAKGFPQNFILCEGVENLDKILQRFWAVFEPRDDGYPHLAPKRPFSKICNQYKFFQKIIPFFLISAYFSRYPILEKTKRDIGKNERAIVSTKREIISTKRALVAIKRALGQTPSPLPRGGSAASWDKNCGWKYGYKGV